MQCDTSNYVQLFAVEHAVQSFKQFIKEINDVFFMVQGANRLEWEEEKNKKTQCLLIPGVQ